MSNEQREQNPDTNSYIPDPSPGEDPGATEDSNQSTDVEVPPNAPVEEPPESDKGPVGDVDDSPKRIA